MDHQRHKHTRQLRRRRHVRSKVQGSADRPRLTVFRSSKHIYAQLVDDLSGKTLASASSTHPDIRKDFANGGNIKVAVIVGKQLAQAAVKAGVTKAAFDRGHYRYHGRIKALADAAREGGLQF